MSRTLKSIQGISKAGRVLSIIVLVFSIIGTVGCAFGIAALALGIGGTAEFGGISISGIVSMPEDMEIGLAYAELASGFVVSAVEVVLAIFAAHYFKNELKAGTPFTFEGAKEMKRLGILAIVLPIASYIIGDVVFAVVAAVMGAEGSISTSEVGSIAIGIMFIVMSCVCKYGAEQNEKLAESGAEEN